MKQNQNLLDVLTREGVLSIRDGQAKVLLDLPEEFSNYCMDLAISVDSCYKNVLLLDVKYTYFYSLGIEQGDVMFTGQGKIEMVWDEMAGAFTESYSDTQSLDRIKFRFLNEKRMVHNHDFALVWRKELIAARQTASGEEIKVIDALMERKHTSNKQSGSDGR